MDLLKRLRKLLPLRVPIRNDNSLAPIQQRLYQNVLLLLNQHHITYSVQDIRDELYSGRYQEWGPISEIEAAINYLRARGLVIIGLSEFPRNIDRPEINVRFNYKNNAACKFATQEYSRFLKVRNNYLATWVRASSQVTDIIVGVAPRNPLEKILEEISYSRRFVTNDPDRPEYREFIQFLDSIRRHKDRINDLCNRVEVITDGFVEAIDMLDQIGIQHVPTREMRNKLIQHKLSKEI